MNRTLAASLLLLSLTGSLASCSSPIQATDAGPTSSDAGADAARYDAPTVPDAPPTPDAGLDAAGPDAGAPGLDASFDGGGFDAGHDAGASDGGSDAARSDAGPCDLSAPFAAARPVPGANDVPNAEISESELSLSFQCPGTGGICTTNRSSTTAAFGVGGLLAGTGSTFAPSMNEARTVLFVHGGAGVLLRYTRATTGIAFTNEGVVLDPGTSPYVTDTGVYYATGGPNQLWFASTVGGSLGTPRRLDSLVVGPVANGDPVVRADGLEIAFLRNGDVWHATRSSTSADFGGMESVPTASPSGRNEIPAGFSADGCRLYFSQDTGSGTYPLYVVERP